MGNIAIIPARSGSKGLIDKNIRPLCGKPLMAYTIEAALKSGLFEKVFVSTDSPMYAEIAISSGASVPFLRNPETAQDSSSSWEVASEVLQKFAEYGESFEHFALLQPTSPLRTAQDIQNGFDVLKEKNAKCVVSVCKTEHSPLLCNILPADHSMNGFITEKCLRTPRQALETFYRLNGAFYLVNVDFFQSGGALYGEQTFAYIMDQLHSIDIDSEMDFQFAGVILNDLKPSADNAG